MKRVYRLFSLILMGALALGGLAQVSAQDGTNDEYRQAIQTFTEEVFNQGNVAYLDETVAPEYIAHPNEEDREAFKQDVQALRAAIPDLNATADLIVIEGDWVFFRFILRGTFQNELVDPSGQAVPPTGKPIELIGFIVGRFNDEGQLVEEWDAFDNLNWLQQLGLFPAEEMAGDMPPLELIDTSEAMTEGMEEAHKEAIMRLVDEGFNQGNLATVDELFTPDYVGHGSGYEMTDLAAGKADLEALRAAFPDFNIEIEALAAEGDWAAALYHLTGTFTNELTLEEGMTIPANNGAIDLNIVTFYHFNEEGRITDDWEQFDRLVFLQQLGVLPMTENAEG